MIVDPSDKLDAELLKENVSDKGTGWTGNGKGVHVVAGFGRDVSAGRTETQGEFRSGSFAVAEEVNDGLAVGLDEGFDRPGASGAVELGVSAFDFELPNDSHTWSLHQRLNLLGGMKVAAKPRISKIPTKAITIHINQMT
jgi:hypothetical protein